MSEFVFAALACPTLTGGDLVSRIPDDCDTMSEYDIACATHALCDALAVPHALGVAHRHVKPDTTAFESAVARRTAEADRLRLRAHHQGQREGD